MNVVNVRKSLDSAKFSAWKNACYSIWKSVDYTVWDDYPSLINVSVKKSVESSVDDYFKQN